MVVLKTLSYKNVSEFFLETSILGNMDYLKERRVYFNIFFAFFCDKTFMFGLNKNWRLFNNLFFSQNLYCCFLRVAWLERKFILLSNIYTLYG